MFNFLEMENGNIVKNMNIIISPMSGFICPKCEKMRGNVQMKTILGENIFMCKVCWDKFHYELMDKTINERQPTFGFENGEKILQKLRCKMNIECEKERE